jgi:hemoglobin
LSDAGPIGPVGAGVSDFERVGGEAGLRAIIEDFTARVFEDVMIGFLFAGKDHRRITEMELRFAEEHLGGPRAYRGRSVREAHRRSPIMGGHFLRRRRLLENTLRDHAVPEDVVGRWLAHVDSLRADVLGELQSVDDCDHDAQALRIEPAGDDPT